MPFVDLHSKFGLNLDRWLLAQSGKQPYKQASRCHSFEKEWIECSHGIGQTGHGRSAGLNLKTFMNACTVRRHSSDSMKSENRKKNWRRRDP
ncbi:hypothetical protein ANANG_G00176030 [Anguilla anguilla]|uniref:NADH dehydrogenase [ubiquinone] iron-sulfur protein 5 n=1 Tax=Anguilla anguilla TaxID=7936 RepID=A0A9D3MB00_ANGAN|nr:hypothetical protein ANANG_G00176030 [Anguilla anguilla]